MKGEICFLKMLVDSARALVRSISLVAASANVLEEKSATAQMSVAKKKEWNREGGT